MSLSLERATAFLGEPNVRAFLRVIREGESSQDESAYRMLYGGKLVDIPPWKHPYYGRTTTEVGHSTAFGAYQFLGTSAKEALDALGIDNDFSPLNQDLCAVWTIDTKRRAMSDVLAGNLVAACAKLADEWVSLPGLGLERVQGVFLEYGGTLTPQTSPAIAPAPDLTPSRPEIAMPIPALALIGPILQAIPALISALGRGERAQQNAKAAEVVVNAFTQAVPGAVNAQDAIERAQADPTVMAQAKAAVMADPAVAGLMEVGGGIAAARAAAANPNAPAFWKTAPFWISILLLVIVYATIGSVLFTANWRPEDKAQVLMLAVAVTSGIMGYFLGSSIGSARKDQLLSDK